MKNFSKSANSLIAGSSPESPLVSNGLFFSETVGRVSYGIGVGGASKTFTKPS